MPIHYSRRAQLTERRKRFRARRTAVAGSAVALCALLTLGGVYAATANASGPKTASAAKPMHIFSLFGATQPQVTSAKTTVPLELGTQFTPRADGAAIGIRFYKGKGNTGTHTGTLWSASGQKLAQVTFTHETASGWQEAMLSKSVGVKAGVMYYVSYNDPHGHFSYTLNYFDVSRRTRYLKGPQADTNHRNGVFAMVSTPGFPTLSGNGTNYFVDVDFVPKDDTPPPSTSTTTDPPTTTSTPTTVQDPPPPNGKAPTTPPVIVCKNASLLTGPATAPAGTVVVPAGDNSATLGSNWTLKPNTTYWIAPGVHTLGTSQFGQIDPQNGDTFIGAPGAVFDGQGKNASLLDTDVTNVTVEYLEVRNFNASHDQGVVNHDSGDGWTVEHNYIHDNHGAALMTGSNNRIAYNCLDHNGQYGINAAGGTPSNLVLDHNEISRNDTDNVEAQISGCGCTGGVKFWQVNGATVIDNYVHDNLSVGLWADTNDRAFDIEGNYISGNWGEGLLYELSYNAHIDNNTFVNNAWGKGPTNPGFPTGAIYISESGGDARVAGGKFADFDVSGNIFNNNWSGVIEWENADRFCNSPNNSSTGVCTLVNPSVATLSSCNANNIPNQPYYSDCRWKTQNISVHDNTFNTTPSAIPGCSFSKGCGFNGVFSNWGSSPSWSPYQGPKVENAITLGQNNRFFNNTYTGAWHFMPMDQSHSLTFSDWRAAPWNQDSNSTMNP